MTVVYVLDVPEFRPVVDAAATDPSIEVTACHPYVALRSDGEIRLERRTGGVRQAVWFSAVAGVADGEVVQFDRDALRIVPA